MRSRPRPVLVTPRPEKRMRTAAKRERIGGPDAMARLG